MANELRVTYNGGASDVVYAILRRRDDGYVYNGSTFVVWANADIANYDILMDFHGGDLYMQDFPAIDAGNYIVGYYIRDGLTPAITDVRIVADIDIVWNGDIVIIAPSDLSGVTAYYADGADLEARFGVEQIKRWSQLDNSTSAVDADRVQLALDSADAEIDNFMRGGPFVVPMNPVNTTFTKWACAIAAHWLYVNRGVKDADAVGDKLSDLVDDARGEMGLLRNHLTRMEIDRAHSMMSTAPVVVT
jgi:phage gp36-like protein